MDEDMIAWVQEAPVEEKGVMAAARLERPCAGHDHWESARLLGHRTRTLVVHLDVWKSKLLSWRLSFSAYIGHAVHRQAFRRCSVRIKMSLSLNLVKMMLMTAGTSSAGQRVLNRRRWWFSCCCCVCMCVNTRPPPFPKSRVLVGDSTESLFGTALPLCWPIWSSSVGASPSRARSRKWYRCAHRRGPRLVPSIQRYGTI